MPRLPCVYLVAEEDHISPPRDYTSYHVSGDYSPRFPVAATQFAVGYHLFTPYPLTVIRAGSSAEIPMGIIVDIPSVRSIYGQVVPMKASVQKGLYIAPTVFGPDDVNELRLHVHNSGPEAVIIEQSEPICQLVIGSRHVGYLRNSRQYRAGYNVVVPVAEPEPAPEGWDEVDVGPHWDEVVQGPQIIIPTPIPSPVPDPSPEPDPETGV